MNNTSVVDNATRLVNESSGLIDPGTATAAASAGLPRVFETLLLFFKAPFIYVDMWWLLVHIILTFVLFELYFEHHHHEELGWSAALANSIVMIFVAMELLRALYGHADSPLTVLGRMATDYFSLGLLSEKMKTVSLVLFLGGLGFFTALINYYHVIPRKLAYLFSGHKTVNLLAYFLMVVVWQNKHGQPLVIDRWTILALLLFGFILFITFKILNGFRRHSKIKRQERKQFRKLSKKWHPHDRKGRH